MLSRRVPSTTGEWLDRLKAERGQYLLARLGIFDSVELNYQTVSSNLWDVRYDLKEGKRIEVSLPIRSGSFRLGGGLAGGRSAQMLGPASSTLCGAVDGVHPPRARR